ncbi:MAG: hypothetical protein RLZZ227_1260 [Pseudomonadota bacterium]|jgi:hypothetical protein
MHTDSKVLELEAKLFAHRRLIQILMKQVAGQQQDPARFWADFDACPIVQDNQEDPGVMQPDIAFAYNSITEFEFSRLVAEAKVAAGISTRANGGTDQA